MGYGTPAGTPQVRLTYSALRDAIKYKGRRGIPGQVHIHGKVWARNEGDDVVMKLHNTDIVTFHPDLTQTLAGMNWPTQLTAHWIWQATGNRPYCFRPNKWSPSYWLYCGVVFQDGMRVRGTEILTEQKFPQAYTPNAEAKALRKKLTALGKRYKDFANMDTTSDVVFPRYGWPEKLILEELDNPEFSLQVYGALQQLHTENNCWKGVLIALQKVYEHEVKRKNLLIEKD